MPAVDLNTLPQAVLDALARVQKTLDAADALVAKLSSIADSASTTFSTINAQVTALAPTIAALPKLATDLDAAIKNFQVKVF
jgi:hypothetical protein